MSDFLERRLIKVVFDTASTDSAGVSNKTAAAHPSGIFVPDNAIITKAFYEVNTGFSTVGGDAGTIAIHVEGGNDIVSTMSVADAGNIWDAGLHSTIVNNWTCTSANTEIVEAALQADSWIKVADHEEVTFTVATQVLTAGKLTLYIEYVTGL